VETILVWTLIISAVAIVAMLAMLFAAERDLQHQRTETEALRASIERARSGRATAASPEDNSGITTEVSAELTALREQWQGSQAALANMQVKLDRLQAENDRLRQAKPGGYAESYEVTTPAAESALTAPLRDSTVRAADRRPNQFRRRSRLLYGATFAVLLLVGGASLYLNGASRETTLRSSSDTNVEPEGQIANTSPADDTARAGDYPKTPNENTARVTPPATPTLSTTTSYEIVRSTRVFSQPNESSRPVARVDAGTEISVVAARDEWLEVRSRHGRPPGFVRKDAAVMK
jgi:hypothetical protein